MRAAVLVHRGEPGRPSVVRVRSRRRSCLELLGDCGPVHRREPVPPTEVDDLHATLPFVAGRHVRNGVSLIRPAVISEVIAPAERRADVQDGRPTDAEVGAHRTRPRCRLAVVASAADRPARKAPAAEGAVARTEVNAVRYRRRPGGSGRLALAPPAPAADEKTDKAGQHEGGAYPYTDPKPSGVEGRSPHRSDEAAGDRAVHWRTRVPCRRSWPRPPRRRPRRLPPSSTAVVAEPRAGLLPCRRSAGCDGRVRTRSSKFGVARLADP